MQLVPCFMYTIAIASLLVAAARGMGEGLKGRVTYRITLTLHGLCIVKGVKIFLYKIMCIFSMKS